MRPRQRVKVLFLCARNSCRSQMAEGWARHLLGEVVDPWSAGVEASELDPLAVKVMAEAGVDISGQRSKRFADVGGVASDWIITVCDEAREQCPVASTGARVMHARFDDPRRLAASARSEEEALGHYRRVRDEIRAFVSDLPAALRCQAAPDGRVPGAASGERRGTEGGDAGRA